MLQQKLPTVGELSKLPVNTNRPNTASTFYSWSESGLLDMGVVIQSTVLWSEWVLQQQTRNKDCLIFLVCFHILWMNVEHTECVRTKYYRVHLLVQYKQKKSTIHLMSSSALTLILSFDFLSTQEVGNVLFRLTSGCLRSPLPAFWSVL